MATATFDRVRAMLAWSRRCQNVTTTSMVRSPNDFTSALGAGVASTPSGGRRGFLEVRQGIGEVDVRRHADRERGAAPTVGGVVDDGVAQHHRARHEHPLAGEVRSTTVRKVTVYPRAQK